MKSTRTCPICARDETRAIAAWRLGYTICECDGCGVLFSDPLPSPEQLRAFYQGFLYRKPDPKRLAKQVQRRAGELARLIGLERGDGLKLLDHGAGTGLTYAAAKQLGFDTYFNDVDQDAIDLVKAQHGLDDAHCITDLGCTTQRFDFIVSDNVIEHVPDPVAVLRQLVALLRPGGALVIKTPFAKANEQLFYPRTVLNYAVQAARSGGVLAALKMAWRAPVWCCDPPRHLYGFTEQSLLAAARAAGVAEASCSFDAYGAPLLHGSLLETYTKRPAGALGVAKRALVAPLLVPELGFKGIHLALRRMNALTPMGLILRVTRPKDANRAA